jgi:glycosyltransferase involved in cell wall biosynthesis
MRVLHVLRDAGEGGATRAVDAIIRTTAVRGIDAFVATPPGPYRFDAPTVAIPLLHRDPRRMPLVAVALARSLRSIRPDVVHCHSIGMSFATAPLTRVRRVPLVLGLHGLPDEEYRYLAIPLKWLPDHVVAYGPGTAAIMERLGVRHRLIYCGVEPPPPPAAKAELAHICAIEPKSPIVFAAGRLVAQKNHIALVRALVHLPEVHVAIAGEGPARVALEAEAVRLKVETQLHMLGFRPDARSLMAAADIVALPSTWEGFGLAAVEAMFARTPLVVGDAPGLREWVKDGETAVLTPPHDPRALADQINLVLDSAVAAPLVSTAYAFASQFTMDRCADAHIELYATVAENTTTHRRG